MDYNTFQPLTREEDAISESTPIVVSMDADLSVAVRKMLVTEVGVLCVDFSEGQKRVVGVITPSNLSRAGSDSNICCRDIMNRHFRYTTVEHLDRDIDELNNVPFMPVVDEGMNLLFVVYRASCHLWNDAQEYEFNWWRRRFERYKNSDLTKLYPSEISLPQQCVSMIQKKVASGCHTCIEIGAGPVLGYIKDVPSTNKRIIIEPLCERYAELRRQYGIALPNEEGITFYPKGGDIFIPDLKDSADIIFANNMLDHTPEWPFVLGNIAEYARKGCLLYIGNDIDHHVERVTGHFNITYNPEKYLRLIRQLGFEIIWRGYWPRQDKSAKTWVSCFARKI